MKELLLVGGGSFAGGIGRYLLVSAAQQWFPAARFPYGTFIVNLIGSFLIGLLMEFISRNDLDPGYRLFLVVGLLGGFTTFSAFSYENLTLFRSGEAFTALLYIFLSIVLCLAATWAGCVAAEAFG